jgi:hypothetical protein
MSSVKRKRWTEDDIEALPLGEHDYFERKSGLLFEDTGRLLGTLAKAISALANSGGGHVVLGMDDAGTPDGVPLVQGRTAMREWLEQKIPHLVEYPLSDFRVHVVERSTPSRIPADREVIVIDIGDSALAPHQCAHGGGDARKYTYYYRQAGRSEPAPHFHLELLRQRLVNPALEAELKAVVPKVVMRVDDTIFLATWIQFLVQNVGRVAAYKWQVQLAELDGYSEERSQHYRFHGKDYPSGFSISSYIRTDDTILPGGALNQDMSWGIFLCPLEQTVEAVRAEIDQMILPLTLGYRLATETSQGELKHVQFRDIVDAQELTDFVVAHVGL